MSQNGNESIVDDRKSGSTCKLQCQPETIREKLNMMANDFRVHIPASVEFANGVHFHHRWTKVCCNCCWSIAGMTNLTSLAAQSLPVPFLLGAGGGVGISQRRWWWLWLLPLVLLVVFVLYEHMFFYMLSQLTVLNASHPFSSLMPVVCHLSIPVWSCF